MQLKSSGVIKQTGGNNHCPVECAFSQYILGDLSHLKFFNSRLSRKYDIQYDIQIAAFTVNKCRKYDIWKIHLQILQKFQKFCRNT